MTEVSSTGGIALPVPQPSDYVRLTWNDWEVSLYLPDADDHIQRVIRSQGRFYEQPMLEDIALRVSPGEVAIDVGAYVGNHTVFLSKCCGMEVFALEPMAYAASILRHNVDINGIADRVTALRIAAGQTPGIADLEHLTPGNLGMTRVRKSRRGSVNVVPIDKLPIDGPVRVLKIDVEGMELDVLKGAAKTIQRHRPWIYVETQNPIRRYQVGAYLAAHKYAGSEVFNFTPTALFEPADTGAERFSATIRALEAQRALIEASKSTAETLGSKWAGVEDSFARQVDGLKAAVEDSRPPSGDNGAVERGLESMAAEFGRLAEDLPARHAAAMSGLVEEVRAVADALHGRLRKSEGVQRELIETRFAALERVADTGLRSGADAFAGAAGRLEASLVAMCARIDRLSDVVAEVAAAQTRLLDRQSRDIELLTRERHHLESRLRLSERRNGPAPLEPKHGPLAIAAPNGSGGDGLVVDDDLRAAWRGWRQNQDVLMQADGTVRTRQSTSTPGVRRNNIAVAPDTLYEIRVDGEFPEGRSRPFLWVQDPASETALTPAAPAEEGPVRFRTQGTTTAIDVGVLVDRPAEGYAFRLHRMQIRRLQGAGRSRDAEVVASLASIPSRQSALKDVVDSLLPQVDRLRVHLNGYDEIPAFLLDPRIDVRRSQDYDDLGDAGKFAWVESDDDGYRLICDDDLVYPPDYVETMLRRLSDYDDRAVLGLHGVLLKQPIRTYHDASSRRVFHFAEALDGDRTVHLLGTNALAYHVGALRLARRDFGYRNMADVWLALQGQDQRVPLVAVARPAGWVVQNPKVDTEESIWDHCTKEIVSPLNSALVQSAVVRQRWPMSIVPPTAARQRRRKLVFAVKTYNRQDYLETCLNTWLETRNPDHDWVVIVADDGSTDGTLAYLEALSLPHEVHVIRNDRRYAVGQTNTIFELCRRIGFEIGFNVDDDVVFTKPGWDDLYIEAIETSGFQHLCYLHQDYWQSLEARRNPSFVRVPPIIDETGTLEGLSDAYQCMGALFTFTPEVLEKVGPADEANFPIRGQWHIDYSVRCARAGLNAVEPFWDARGSNAFIELQNTVSADYRCALPWDEDYKATKREDEINRRLEVIHDAGRVRLPWPGARVLAGPPAESGLNGFFERIVVLNLDRRADRWERISRRCRAHGIRVTRFAAVDGKAAPHVDEWRSYAARPPSPAPEFARPVTCSREFYLDYDSEVARVAYLEAQHGRPAIATAGAWGYLKSMIAVLEQALEDGISSLLVLDDDALFHRDFRGLFAAGIGQLPTGWKIFQLGALQYHWDDGWIRHHSDNLYQCNGTSVGSHAVGMDCSILPMLLEHARRMTLPYDIGALHAAKHAFPDACFTFLPNLVIQDTSESDINSSDVQFHEGSRRGNVYRWDLDLYDRQSDAATA